MRNDGTQAIADLAEVNPPIRVRLPEPSAEVSFVPMSDVSESGEWVHSQTRRLADIGSGFTPFQEGDVLFAKITPCMENGKGFLARGLANGVGFGSTEFHVLRAKPGVEPRFVFHLAHWPTVRKKAECMMIGSAGQQRVSAEFFTHFRVHRFDTTAQRHIADILDAADEAIRQAEAVIAKLKLMKDGLLHDLLTRGLDAQGRLRDPVAHPEQFKDSPLGRIPKEWAVRPLVDVADVASGVTLGRELQGTATIELPYLRVANVQDGYIDLSEVKTVRVLRDEVERFQLQTGDVVMTEGGDFDKLGRGTVWRGQISPCLHQNHIFRVRCRPGMLHPDFLAAFTASHLGKRYFLLSSKQTTNLASINSTQLKALPVTVPSIMEQERIVEVIRASSCRLETETATLEKLKRQKTGLMHDLLTGRVPVASAEVAKRA